MKMRPLFQQQIAARIPYMMSYLANKADHDQPFTSISSHIAAAHASCRPPSAQYNTTVSPFTESPTLLLSGNDGLQNFLPRLQAAVILSTQKWLHI